MTKHTITMLLSAFVLLLTSCQEKERFVDVSDGDAVQFIIGSKGNELSKAVYAGNTETPGDIEKIYWKKGDMLRLYSEQALASYTDENKHYADYKALNDTDAENDWAELIQADPTDMGLRFVSGVDDYTFYGMYPSPLAGGIGTGISKNTVTANLASEQGFVSATSASGDWTVTPDLKWMLMTAETSIKLSGTPGGAVSLVFTPLTTAVKFTVTNDTEGAMPIKKVMLISKGTTVVPTPSAISGEFTVDIHGGNAVTKGAATGTEVSIDLSSQNISLAKGETLTFTFFLAPTKDKIDDLTFRFYKTETAWMQTRLGYTDGSGIEFPKSKKTIVKGVMLPEGAQWTVKYAPDVEPWNPESGDPDFNPEFSGDPIVTSWDTGIDAELELKPQKDNLLPGKFSVSAVDYVQFSRGNLFCTRSGSEDSYTYEFGLEINQYDCRTRYGYTDQKAFYNGVEGLTPEHTSGSFQWGVSSGDFGAFSDGSEFYSAEYMDWGPAMGSDWTTLAQNEWNYIINSRTCDNRFAKAIIGSLKGLLLFPDDWTPGTHTINGINNAGAEYSINGISISEFSQLESEGVVFLPASGCSSPCEREDGTYHVEHFNEHGNYYTSTITDDPFAVFLGYDKDGIGFPSNQNYGRSVRLVQKFPKPIEYVEIAGLKWATENLAVSESGMQEWKGLNAEHPTGHIVGDYFQWAASYEGYNVDPATATPLDLLTYTEFSHKNCVSGATSKFTFKDGGNQFYTKCATAGNYSVDAVLNPSDDPASVILGGGWRMPTNEELKDLVAATYCAWDATDCGCYVFEPQGTTYPKNKFVGAIPEGLDKKDALLFFPACGYGDSWTTLNAFSSDGTAGYYSSSTCKVAGTGGNRMHFNSSTILPDGYGYGYFGFSIRPVHD